MKVWCDTVDQAAIGKTAGTFDNIGTITIKAEKVAEILGIAVLVADSGPTSGLSSAAILRVTSGDLGIAAQDFILSNIVTEAIGTHDKEAPVLAEWIPFKQSAGVKLGNAKVQFLLSTNVNFTEGFDIAAGLVYADGKPDSHFEMQLASGSCARCIGGKVAEADAGIDAATLAAFTNKISVLSRASELVGLSGFVITNAPTAKEACVGAVNFDAPSIDGFAPQLWPFNLGYSASLGTPVGTPVPVQCRNGLYWPTRFPLPQVNFDITPSMILATALSNAGDGMAAARYR